MKRPLLIRKWRSQGAEVVILLTEIPSGDADAKLLDRAINAFSRELAADAILALVPPVGQEVSLSSSERGGTPSAKSEGPSSDGWRDIASAPKDGRTLLLWSLAWEGTWGVQAGHFDGHLWVTAEGEVGEDEWENPGDDEWGDEDGPVNLGPTHWMPLPGPPAESGAAVAVATATCAGTLPPDNQNPTPTGGGEP